MEEAKSASHRIWKPFSGWRLGRRRLLWLGLGAALLAASYTEENWRGKRAWEKCKIELEAKGAILDRAAFSLPPVADEHNFFKAPKMADWFESRERNELLDKLSLSNLAESPYRLYDPVLATVLVVAPETTVAPEDADIVLSYRDSVLALSGFGPPKPTPQRRLRRSSR